MAQSLTQLSCLLETFCNFIRRQNGVSPRRTRRAAFTGYNSGKDIMFQNISRSLTMKSERISARAGSSRRIAFAGEKQPKPREVSARFLTQLSTVDGDRSDAT